MAILSYEIWRHPRALKIAYTLVKHGYRVKLWGARKPVKYGPRFFSAIMNYLLSILEVSSIKADLYWIENIPDIAYISIPLLGKKYVYDRRSPWAKEVQLEFGLRILPKFIEIIERYMIKKAKYITVVSTPMLYEYEYTKPVTVIPNYPEENFIRKPSRNLRKELGIADSTKIFIFIGKLSRVEGIDLLVEAASRLRNIDAELWIVGDGPARNIVERLVKEQDNVRWFGWIERKFLADYISASNYGLIPRHRTPFSIFYNHEGVMKIGEYFAYGKPVIACGIAPSPYYLVVEPKDFANTVLRVAKGEIKPPSPPSNLLWELYSEKRLLKVIEYILSNKE